MKEKSNITLWILITTMNNGINRVKKELLSQLKNVDEIIISHQITDKNIIPENIEEIKKYHKNIKYVYMNEKWLSKNRNNALKYSNTDICHICDDDLNYIKWFEKIIKKAYEKNDYDIITFQAENNEWKKHFKIKEWKHNRFSILKIWSWGIIFRRNNIIQKNIKFDENFWLWAQYSVWEENIFLTECYKKGLKIFHNDNSIVIHPDESSWINYKNRKDLIIARIKVFKKLFWFIWWFVGIFYFTISHYKYYKNYFSIEEFFILSFKSFINYGWKNI